MGKRSRLRTQNVGRRRLVVLIVLLIVVAAFWGWVESDRTLLLREQAGKLLKRGTGQLTTEQELTRGTIYDRNYKEFAISYERVSVYANIREIEDVNQVIGPLSAILETSESDLYDRMGKGRLRVWLARDISQDQEDEIRELDSPGVHLHREHIRYYPQGESAAHLIGFAEGDTGLSGIEEYLNKLEARYRMKVDDARQLPQLGGTRPGIDGRHLILTLDSKIQRILENYLAGLSAAAPDSRYGALVMDAKTGGLVGYAQTPSFDPNGFHTYQQDRFIDLFNEKIAVPGPVKRFLKDLSLLESQTGSADSLLPWSIAAEQRKLGVQLQLWNRLGIDGSLTYDFISSAPGEYGAVPYRKSQSVASEYETIPEMLTPLQLLTALTRSGNGGHAVTPQASKRFVLRRNQQEFLLEELEKPGKAGLLSEAVSSEALKLLEQLGRPGPMGANIIQGQSHSVVMSNIERLYHHQLGLIMIPAQSPELIMLVTSTGPGYQVEPRGELTLVGAASKIIGSITALEQVMKNLSDMMTPTIQEDINFRRAAGEPSVPGTNKIEAAPVTEMASFVGMSLRKSLRLLQSVNVEIEIRGSGRVVEQHPPPGAELQPGARVTLILKRDPVDPAYRKPQFTEPE